MKKKKINKKTNEETSKQIKREIYVKMSRRKKRKTAKKKTAKFRNITNYRPNSIDSRQTDRPKDKQTDT